MSLASESTAYLVYFALTGLAVYYALSNRRKRKNYPPGPIGLPIIGNILSIGNEMHVAFGRYVKKYGSIFSVKLASEEAVVLHGIDIIKEAFNHPNLIGRPDKETGQLFLTGGRDGIIFNNGKSWSDQRRFTIRQLREFGLGKKSLEGLIMDEVMELVDWIKKQNGQPVALKRRFSLAMTNALWTILSGRRYNHDDPMIVGILDQLETTAKAVLSADLKSLLRFFYPSIAKFFPNWSDWNYLLKSIEPRHKLFAETVEEHKATLPDGHPRDFIDAYLQEVKKTDDPNSSFYKSKGESALRSVMADFFLAGSDTTTSSLNWSMLYLIHNPEIQTKLQNELDKVIGRSRFASLTDRNSLPYVEAFIMEVFRMSTVVSFGVPHETTADAQLSNGYIIRKHTVVYSSLYTTHHDPKVWGDPENFRPERFLSPDGSKVQKHESLIPFSTGKRQCPGEVLARDQIFLFITTLLQTFKISKEEGKPLPSLDIVCGKLTLEPRPFLVVMKERV